MVRLRESSPVLAEMLPENKDFRSFVRCTGQKKQQDLFISLSRFLLHIHVVVVYIDP